MDIKTVTVIGATGTMGANVAGIFASFGDAKVFCIGRDIEKVRAKIPSIVLSVKADSITGKLIPADFSMLEECVKESDLIFESLAETFELKAEIAKRVGQAMRNDAISCTGTSGLSVTKLAQCYPKEKQGRFFGVHMFNPPYNMSLCEFIKTEYSELDLAKRLMSYLKDRLIRTVVLVEDSPAFLGNRIGFQFINEALQYAQKYKDNGGIDYIDYILGPFTGRSMPPITTSNFVGLDVHKAIVDNLYDNTNDYARDTFVLPDYVAKLIDEGKLGRKSGEGLYKTIKYDNGTKRTMVFDIKSGIYRDKFNYAFPFVDSMKKSFLNGDYEQAFRVLIENHSQEAEICLSFLLKYIVYSLYTAKSIGDSLDAADDVMATGFNWCPPIAMYDALSKVTDVVQLLKERLPEISKQTEIDKLIDEDLTSAYDFRPFFKSGR